MDTYWLRIVNKRIILYQSLIILKPHEMESGIT
jgi:hypothetical protein